MRLSFDSAQDDITLSEVEEVSALKLGREMEVEDEYYDENVFSFII